MSTTPKTAAAAPKTAASRHQQPPLKCPRCDSPNTKFCYFNNYSLSQPRHFCKTCRRYWTHGGALRTVPIGGGCRKNKKIRSPPPLSGDSSGGLKFFQGVTPAMDFNQLNFNFTTPVTAAMFDFPVNPEMGFRSSLVSSIESLSSINQDLHWKMQKQRLAMLLPGDARKNSNPGEPSYRKPPQIMDDNLEFVSSRKDGGGGDANLSTEWFFDNCYATPATSNAGAAENSSGWSSGVQGWSDLSQFSSVP